MKTHPISSIDVTVPMTDGAGPSGHRPPDPTANNVQTFYRRPLIDRLTGRYTVSWETGGHVASIRVHNRLTDLEGFKPGPGSLMRIPRTVRTYLEAKRRPILRDPVPFLVYEAIDHLATLVGPGTSVVELGGGNSTLWFLARGAKVTTVEHSEEWALAIREAAEDRLGPGAAERLTIVVAEGETAIDVLESLAADSVDIALVDCMNAFTWRKAGVEAVLPAVRPGGTLCLDNSDHPNNWAAVTLLGRESRVRFTGYAPMCPVVSQTSFWRKPS